LPRTARRRDSNYDSFLDPRTWLHAGEIERLRAIYGWSAL
jgi:hypothetical protein